MAGKRYFLPLLLLLAFILSLFFYGKVQSYAGITGFFYEKEGLSREQYSEYWKDPPAGAKREIKGTVLLSKEKKIRAENISTGAKKEATLITAAGDMSLAAPGALMFGGFAGDGDEMGCVISRKAAEELFGTRKVTGQQIRLEKDTYTIRGVLDMEEAVCMVQGKRGMVYHAVRVNAPGLPASAITQLMPSCIPANYTGISEGGLYAGIARLAVFLPAWVLMFRFFRTIRKKKYLSALSGVVFPVVVFGMICLLLLVSIRFSDDYVPTSWSDFEFWSGLFAQKWEQTCALLKADLLFADGKMLWQTAACILSSAVCTMGMIFCPFQSSFENSKNPAVPRL